MPLCPTSPVLSLLSILKQLAELPRLVLSSLCGKADLELAILLPQPDKAAKSAFVIKHS